MAAQSPVSQEVFDKLNQYQAFAAAAYADECATPPGGSQVIQYFNDAATDTQGTLFRQSSTNELVLSFRGTSTPADLGTDLTFLPVALSAAGTSCSGCLVHQGFQASYNAVSSAAIAAVKKEMSNGNPSFIITGHSLGAAIASIAASSFASQGIQPTVYTYGEPRNGNAAFTDYINGLISPEEYFRVTHSNDGVPQIPPTLLGFQHHGTEYWQSSNTSNTPETVLRCEGNEPANCNNGEAPGDNPINRAHISYSDALIGNSLHIFACGATTPVVPV